MGTSDDGGAPTVRDAAPGSRSPADDSAEALMAALRAVVEAPRYELEDPIGKGGMAEVRSALDRRVGREVAVKILASPEGLTAEAITRFVREARVQGLLDHPSIVPVHDIGIDDHGRPYIVMRRLSGWTLSEVLIAQARGDAAMRARFPRLALLSRFADICLAIEFAHTRGVVHRDLKPTNIMLGDFGESWVLDWGVAKLAADAPEPRPHEIPDTPTTGETSAGTVLGTPGYIAPEQIAADTPYDHRVDVYALGCVLFELLAGVPLHPRGRPALRSTLRGVDARPSVRKPDADIPPELDAVCVRATAVDPDQRYSTVRELHDAVRSYLDGDRDLARRRELAAGHRDAAVTALEHSDRATAMREAGRALALDPTDDASLGIVTRVMIERPAQLPREAEIAVQRALVRTAHAEERAFLAAYAGFGAFIPILFWLGLRDLGWLLALIGGIAAVAAVAWTVGRVPAISVSGLWLAIIGNVFVIVMTSRIISPYVVSAALAPPSVMVFVMHPTLRRPWTVVIAYMAALALPIALEHLGWLGSTFDFRSDGILFRSTVIDTPPVPSQVLLTGFCLFHVAMAGVFASFLTREQRQAQRQVHLQAWHLRQLVPVSEPQTPAAQPSQTE